MNNNIAVITGDIVNSKTDSKGEWKENLLLILNKIGTEPIHWEIYRGDSFQVEVSLNEAFYWCMVLKAQIKTNKLTDVRLAIGVGNKTKEEQKVTQSNGTAFINSGTCFENLKKTRLAIKTNNAELDQTLNIMFGLASLTTDHWAPAAAFATAHALLNQDLNQKQLADKLNKSQSTISEALNRAGYDSINELNTYYQKQINKL